MAVLHSQQKNSVHYKVTRAGNTTRLYTNGVFHSQFNKVRPLGGAIWDLLSLPAVLSRQAPNLRVLVLGVGGGAVIQQLHYLLDSPDITGIDIDASHLSIARRWFGVTPGKATLIHADALVWMRDCAVSGAQFDIVIDDLFDGDDGDPKRVVNLDVAWCRTLAKVLAPEGIVIVNSLSAAEIRKAPLRRLKHLSGGLIFSHKGYENRVGLYADASISRRQLTERLIAHPGLTAHDRRVARALLVPSRVVRFSG